MFRDECCVYMIFFKHLAVGNELNMCYTEDTGGQASNRAQRLL